MSNTTQPSSRKDGFGTEGIGEDGDGSMGQAGSSGGGTGATSTAGRGATKTQGATGKENGGIGRQNEANKQGLDGDGPQD